MKNNRRSNAILGLILNAGFPVFLLVITVAHIRWESLNLLPEKRLLYDEQMFGICCYKLLPVTAGAMILSAVLFWKLRKND